MKPIQDIKGIIAWYPFYSNKHLLVVEEQTPFINLESADIFSIQ